MSLNLFLRLALMLSSASVLVSCSDMIDDESIDHSSYLNHDVSWDLEPITDEKGDGLVDKFDPNWLMSDSFFTNAQALNSTGLQFFFESTPYGHRSWLADTLIDGVPASVRIVQVAHELDLNPLLLLTRMQIEQSLISRKSQPSARSVDFAFGCGCPDYEQCQPKYRGLSNQLKCAGQTLNKLYFESKGRRGLWVAGKARKTLDKILVTPANHSTAALYAYTPWLLKERGGNWLAWNIMRKFTQYLKKHSLLFYFEGERGNMHIEGCLYQSGRAFIGDACSCESDCEFWSGSSKGTCHPAGFCTLPCEGTCPEISGKAPTFCIENTFEENKGICVPKASELNGHCADLPETLDQVQDRFIGQSQSTSHQATVCTP